MPPPLLGPAISLEYSFPDSLSSRGTAGSRVLYPQANVEHMTEKMKTEIQRGLVLR